MRRRYLKTCALIGICVLVQLGCATSPRYTRGASGRSLSESKYRKSNVEELSSNKNRYSANRNKSRPAERKEKPAAGSSSGFVPYVVGTASYYAHKFHGRQTANGERYDMYALTAAHKKLPFGTMVRVTNLSNNRSVIVRINDRGPFVGNRVIDLSLGAAKAIEMVQSGTARVRLEIKQ